MGILIGIFRKYSLISEINLIQATKMKLQKKLRDLHSYVSLIADGKVSMNDLMNVPAAYFGAMSIFMVGAHNMAAMSANQKMAYMSQVPGAIPPMADPMMQQQYMQAMQMKLYDQSRKEIAQRAEDQARIEGDEIQAQIAIQGQQLDLLQAELKQVTEETKNAAKEMYA